MIAIGLIGCLAAALLSTGRSGGPAELHWEDKTPLADSKPAAIPGGGALALTDAGIRASALNVSGYRLYRVAAVLRIGAGSAIGQSRVRCAVKVPKRTIAAHTPDERASYPKPGEDLVGQPVPLRSTVEFNTHNTDLVAVELSDAFPVFTERHGIVVEWAAFQRGQQAWNWGMPRGRPTEEVTLGFASIWRTTVPPSAEIACALTNSGGTATARTAGTLR